MAVSVDVVCYEVVEGLLFLFTFLENISSKDSVFLWCRVLLEAFHQCVDIFAVFPSVSNPYEEVR